MDSIFKDSFYETIDAINVTQILSIEESNKDHKIWQKNIHESEELIIFSINIFNKLVVEVYIYEEEIVFRFMLKLYIEKQKALFNFLENSKFEMKYRESSDVSYSTRVIFKDEKSIHPFLIKTIEYFY